MKTISRSWYEFNGAEDEVAELLIYDSIGYWGVAAETFVKDLQGVTAKKINIKINSPGGNVFDGLAIYNALRAHPATVDTVVEGVAASMASVIMLAGDHASIAEAAFVMIHNPWGMAIGDADEMRETADVLDKLTGTLADIYSRKTGMGVDEIKAKMNDETWFTGSEALDFGLVDDVYDTEEIAAAAFDLSLFDHTPDQLLEIFGLAETTDQPVDEPDTTETVPDTDYTETDTVSEQDIALAERKLRLCETK